MRPVSAKSKKSKVKEEKIAPPKKVEEQEKITPQEPNYFVEELKNVHETQEIPRTDIDSVFESQAKEDEILDKKRKLENRKNTTSDL